MVRGRHKAVYLMKKSSAVKTGSQYERHDSKRIKHEPKPPCVLACFFKSTSVLNSISLTRYPTLSSISAYTRFMPLPVQTQPIEWGALERSCTTHDKIPAQHYQMAHTSERDCVTPTVSTSLLLLRFPVCCVSERSRMHSFRLRSMRLTRTRCSSTQQQQSQWSIHWVWPHAPARLNRLSSVCSTAGTLCCLGQHRRQSTMHHISTTFKRQSCSTASWIRSLQERDRVPIRSWAATGKRHWSETQALRCSGPLGLTTRKT